MLLNTSELSNRSTTTRAHLLSLLDSQLRLLKLSAQLYVAAFVLSSLLLQGALLSCQSLIVLDQALHLSEITVLVLQALACHCPDLTLAGLLATPKGLLVDHHEAEEALYYESKGLVPLKMGPLKMIIMKRGADLQCLLCCGGLPLQSCLQLSELLLHIMHLGLRCSQGVRVLCPTAELLAELLCLTTPLCCFRLLPCRIQLNGAD